MPEQIFEVINWDRPWLTALRSRAEPIICAPNWRSALNAAASESELINHRSLPIRFVPQATLPAGTSYEAFISATGQVPTRENLHDFFNALIWLTFPNIKRQLNALQVKALSLSTPQTSGNHVQANTQGSRRGQVRDAATIFDENAALLIVRDETFLNDIRQHRWEKIFIEHRSSFFHYCEVWLFGHALIEKLVNPYKAITAHAWPVLINNEFFTLSQQDKQRKIDSIVASQMQSGIFMAQFTPLPVLGIPGWWTQQDVEFYSDVSVFRPAKKHKHQN